MIWSFEKARQYFPNAKLLINDYNIINSDSATTQYLTIINLLKDRGLIDGIGEQAHFYESTSLTTLQNNLNRLAATGLPIYISELDINLADDTAQLNRYQALVPGLLDQSCRPRHHVLGLQARRDLANRWLPAPDRWQRTPGHDLDEKLHRRQPPVIQRVGHLTGKRPGIEQCVASLRLGHGHLRNGSVHRDVPEETRF